MKNQLLDICPKCGRHSLRRLTDSDGLLYPYNVGVCLNSALCGYSYDSKQYLSDRRLFTEFYGIDLHCEEYPFIDQAVIRSIEAEILIDSEHKSL